MFAEQRVLAVATDHQLAPRASVSLEMVSDFQHPHADTGPGYWYDAYAPRLTRRGRQIERGPVVRDAEEAMTLASMDGLVVLFPAHVTRYWVRPDIAYLPVTDMEPLSYALVWRSEAESEPIRALAGVIRDLGPLPPAPAP
ncbi:LysR substrate-binding domain-containing protein [Nonomuraea helvata]|uniref:LysR substrate-binding domain-containing protein n=1 Tax=Nonomuraea helvata TaxID=37484 RepID=A0ABV5SEE9_9ACTN